MSRARDTANQINRVNSSAADATAITVDSSENVGIGTSSPAGVLHANSSGHTKTYITSGTSNDAQINFGDSDDNDIGGIHYDNAQNSMKFLTNTSERLRIDSDGLKFNGDTAAANALDDYEEGTFEPTIIGTSSSPTVTYQADNGGSYTKIGRVVYYTGCVRWTALSGGSGTARIGNLPFTSAARTNGDNADSIGTARTSIWNGTSSNHPTIIGMVAGNTTLTLIANASTGTAATLQISDLGTNCSFQFTCIAYV